MNCFRSSVVRCGLVVLTVLVCSSYPGPTDSWLFEWHGGGSIGAAVSGATVSATNSAINVTQTTTTQHTGFFQIFNLPIGTYGVKVSLPGFETTELKGITVQEARATTLNADAQDWAGFGIR